MVIMPYNKIKKYLISGNNLKNITYSYIKQKYNSAIQSKSIKKLEYVLKHHPEFTKRQEALKILLQAYSKIDTVNIYD